MRNISRTIPAFVFGLAILGVATPSRTPAQQPKPARTPPCSAPEYHQFDFAAGDWDTYDLADSSRFIARNRVTHMLGACALREVYDQNDGMHGESFTMYDATRHGWHQSWVTNHGTLLLFDGSLDGKRMVFTAKALSAAGKPSLQRVVWSPEHGSVRETAESSTDSGKTWTPLFDIVFRPHKNRP